MPTLHHSIIVFRSLVVISSVLPPLPSLPFKRPTLPKESTSIASLFLVAVDLLVLPVTPCDCRAA
eukprot:5277279-Prorocentrum_lima.AAC.1